MLTELKVHGYGPFSGVAQLELRRLNVIFGKNNSGKTTLARAPIFVSASLGNESLYALASGDLKFGNSFRDLAYAEHAHPLIKYSVADDSSLVQVALQAVTSDLTDRVTREVLVVADGEPDVHAKEDLRAENSIPGHVLRAVVERGRNLVGEIVHIPSARPAIAPVYEVRAPQNASVGEVPYWLLSDAEVADAVEKWFTEFADEASVRVEQSGYAFRLVTGSTAAPVNFASAGRGLHAMLPIVVLAQAIMLGKLRCDVLVVEEPEAHLHPSIHIAIADLLWQASTHCQVITETHSENLILRMRRRIATDDLDGSDLRLVFVDGNQELRNVEVDSTGGVDYWPEGVFEYDIEEARAIVEARLKARG